MAEQNKKLMNYKFIDLENFYVAINPNIEVEEQGYVWFNSDEYERDNAYPNKLLDYYKNSSSVHSNFINLKSTLTYGSNGLVPKDKNNLVATAWLKKRNRAGQTFNDIYKKMSMDFALFEAAALQVIYDSNGNIAEVYHCSPSFLRAKEPNDFGFVEEYLYSDKWGIVQNKRRRRPENMVSDAICIKAFNPEMGKTDMRQILYIKKYTSGHDIYAIPSYNSALNWIQLDFELSQFHLNKVINGFTPSAILTLIGNPDDDEKDKFVKGFKRNHIGSNTTGKIIFNWVDGEQAKPIFERLEADPNEGMYQELNNIVTQKISTAHGASLELAGIDEKGQSLGGDANKLNVQRAYFIDNVIKGFQDALLMGINRITELNGVGELTVTNDPLKLTQPLGTPEDLTLDERRDILYGLPPIGLPNGSVPNSTGNISVSGATPATPFNAALAGMSGRQFQNMNRIVRQIANGKLTKEAGIALLKASYGFDDALIASLLIDDEIEDIKEEENLPPTKEQK